MIRAVALNGSAITVEADMVVLFGALTPPKGAVELARMLDAGLDEHGFFAELQGRIDASRSKVQGVFLAGACQGPMDIQGAASQGMAAAGYALSSLVEGRMLEISPVKAAVDETRCSSCHICQTVCPYTAIRYPQQNGPAWVNDVLCTGLRHLCGGLPVRRHRRRALHQRSDYGRTGGDAEMSVAEFEPKIVGFLCNWCSYAGADKAGSAQLAYPPNMTAIRVMCSGRVDPQFVLEAFARGADGVMILACHPGDCHYKEGTHRATQRHSLLLEMLEQFGIERERCMFDYVSAAEGERFARLVAEAVVQLKQLGPRTPRPVAAV